MKRTIFITVFCFLAAVSGFAQVDLQPAATVNLIRTEAITVRQLRSDVERRQSVMGRALTQAERLQVLDLMINERLVLQAAERDRITVTENELNQKMQEHRSSMAQSIGRQPTDTEFAQEIMAQTGFDLPSFREETRRQLIVQKYLLTKKADLINSIRAPTDEEIAAEYNIRRTQFIRPQTVRFSMIQVPYGPDAASKERARTLANSLYREIGSSPSRFDEVAARSAVPNSGYQAGDAGYLPLTVEARDALGSNFLNIAFSLSQGQVSTLIEGVQGFQIIKVTENYEERRLELHDIAQLGTNVTVRAYLGQYLLSLRQQEIVTRASQELVAELRAGRTFQIFENNLNW